MSTHLLTINGTDFTGWVSRKKYSASHEEEGFTWKDINLVNHRTVQRIRIKAKATLVFFNDTDFDGFRAALGDLTRHTVVLYVDTLGEDRTITAAIKYSTQTVWTAQGFGEVAGIRVVNLEISEL